MASVHDVAAYILQSQGPMTAMKLQKLCYYSHAWHLVWEERPLFPEPIEAWANGPVVRDLYNAHRRQFTVGPNDLPQGDPRALAPPEIDTIDRVIAFYGPWSAHDLSELTHRELPWREARADLSPGERGETQITDVRLYEYYDSLTGDSAEA